MWRIIPLLFAGLLLCAPVRAATCAAGGKFFVAALANADSLTASPWTFTAGREGAAEGPGWEAYAALIAHTIGTDCDATTPAFAAALAKWQGGVGLKPTGVMAPATAERLKHVWHAKRRHVARAAAAPCLIAGEGQVVAVAAADVWGKPEKLLPGAYKAYRKMMEAARREAPHIFAGNANLAIVSAWRTQERDAERCKDGQCSAVSMAKSCSAHWGGHAVDLNVGFVEGHSPADMDWQNRVYQSRTAAYRWLLNNAGRFGFDNYFAEPWHWEWGGD